MGGFRDAGTHKAVAAVSEVVGGKAANYTLTGNEMEFAIAKADISKLSAEPMKDLRHTGEPRTPKMSIKMGDAYLVEGRDYDMSYENNTDAGTAVAKATGKGNYEGVLTATFSIISTTPKDLGVSTTSLGAAVAAVVLAVAAAGVFVFLRVKK